MITRFLSTLNYPDASSVNINDEKELRKIIAWLEDTIIRKYNQEQRTYLLNIDSPEWNKAYSRYKQVLKCPVFNCFNEEFTWILFYAIKHKHDAMDGVANIMADVPADKLDFSSKYYEDSIKELASILNIPPHPNLLMTHRAAIKIINNKLNYQALENPEEFIIKGPSLPLESIKFGVDLYDEQLNKAIKMLHLLFIQNLKDLQIKCNELIVGLQTITANPKTNTALGNVGI